MYGNNIRVHISYHQGESRLSYLKRLQRFVRRELRIAQCFGGNPVLPYDELIVEAAKISLVIQEIESFKCSVCENPVENYVCTVCGAKMNDLGFVVNM